MTCAAPTAAPTGLPGDGHSRGKQTHRCRDCLPRFTPEGNRHYFPETVKRQALEMYAEETGIAALGRVLGGQLTTVFSWVKKSPAGGGVGRQGSPAPGGAAAGAAASQGDSLCRNVELRGGAAEGEAAGGLGLDGGGGEGDGARWVDFEVGRRDQETLLRLYERLPDAELYRSDHYVVYAWLPQDRQVAGRGGAVNRNEGLRDRLRDRLRRLQRKTRGYNKSVAMLRGSIALNLLEVGPDVNASAYWEYRTEGAHRHH